MAKDVKKIKEKLIVVLSQEKGYFGRIDTWGQRPTKYEYVGYELSTDIYPVLENISEEQLKNLVRVINYFEIHVSPLKKILERKDDNNFLLNYYSDICWSHFMIVVMFGMLEIVAKTSDKAKINKRGSLNNKGETIKQFLIDNLSEEKKLNIPKRYKVDNIFGYKKKIETFSDVIDHLWHQIRSGFIHEAGLESKGLEWNTLSGLGKEEPIKMISDVPVQELLQIAWEAILHFYGYDGCLVLPKYKNK